MYITTGNADDLYRRVKDRVQIVEDLCDAFYGMREFVIRDINGFWVTFGQPMQNAPRLTGASCGTAWIGTYTFDPFGNITKSGSMNFAASYAPTTNRMTLIGASTPSYDANRNVTNDFAHTYAWDAEGKPVTQDGVGLTYDALLRAIYMDLANELGDRGFRWIFLVHNHGASNDHKALNQASDYFHDISQTRTTWPCQL